MSADVAISPHFRCGYVAIIGEPNVGKSTLMNTLLGQKVSIVTPKPQTTRHRVLGILSSGEYQAVFLDTPGLIEPAYGLQAAMMRAVARAITDADVLVVMVDATRPPQEFLEHRDLVSRYLESHQGDVTLAINKIDLVHKEILLPLIDQYSRAYPFKEIIPISAAKADGTETLVRVIVQRLPEHPPLYPPDVLSEHPERFFVAEIIREKVFLACREEVPYATTVEIVEFKERESQKHYISAEITVERESQKAILIGRKGTMLRTIGSRARADIEVFLDHPVFLELRVKVRSHWRDDEEWLKRMGYA